MTGIPSSGPAHGGMVHEELVALGLSRGDVLDVSVNVNPYGPCPTVMEAIRSASISDYPDPTGSPAREHLAEWVGVPKGRIVLGNGAVDLMWGIARCLIRENDRVLIVEPAFSEFRSAAEWCGAVVCSHRLTPESDFHLDEQRLDAVLTRLAPKLVYIASPANPTGVSVPLERLAALAERHTASTFVVDLSFASLSSRPPSAPFEASPRIVTLQSLTKDFALAGLRVGFGVFPEPLAALVERSRPPWSVNALASAAAVSCTAPATQDWRASTRALWLSDRVRQDERLLRIGLRPHPSDSVFSLVDLGPRRSATELRHAMLTRHAVLLRDGATFGLPHHVRIGARPRDTEDRLFAALQAELEPKP